MRYYSASQAAFFDSDFEADYKAANRWPTDLVEVTQVQVDTYVQPAPAGQMLGADASGNPAWVPLPAPTLSAAQTAQIESLYASFTAASHADIAFSNAAGTASTYQADETARARISRALASYTPVGSVPTGFYWVDAANAQQPFTLADLQGFAKAIADREWADFQHLQTLKSQVMAATTVAAVQAVTW